MGIWDKIKNSIKESISVDILNECPNCGASDKDPTKVDKIKGWEIPVFNPDHNPTFPKKSIKYSCSCKVCGHKWTKTKFVRH
ncbi:hypothetical protein Cal7507_5499 [Calothrix sp. PCC 7507]|nr:hypothetical protein Cal7507_5499 [Calothrix sp. PCC 7507]